MKLETSHMLRLDGTVIVTGLNKRDYIFAPDADGMVSCDVDHKETVAHLLTLGGFFPANEADHEKAAELIEQTGKNGLNDQEHDGDGDEEDDDKPNPNALPVEANTPPASIPNVNKGKPAAKASKARGK